MREPMRVRQAAGDAERPGIPDLVEGQFETRQVPVVVQEALKRGTCKR